ncbi:hypothetical protein ACMFA3_24300 (plasmid) [Escherichia coli]
MSNAENPQGWKPNYFAGSVATYDANRIVKCGFYDEYNFHKGTFRADLTGKCSYVVACAGLRANPVGGQGVIKLITQHVIGTNHP